MKSQSLKKPSLRGFFLVFFILLIWSGEALSQYYPRGVRYNDNYLPNLDQPDKWLGVFDGFIDWEKSHEPSQTTTFEGNHFHLAGMYGGQTFRGGLQIRQDHGSGPNKDLAIGLALAFFRPLFLELGFGYLLRDRGSSSDTGWAFNGKFGYELPLVLKVNYRLRLRISGNFTYKSLSGTAGSTSGRQFYPMLGLEYEM